MLLVPEGPRMNVYIKSFNRPFYLERCIRSIEFFATGVHRIIVLDDGTLSRYLDKLKVSYPRVEVRSSGADDGKYELLREERFADIQHRYPLASDFWTREIRKEGDSYFFMMEDDAWISRRLDLSMIRESLEEAGAVICKFWWGDARNHAHDVYASYQAPSGTAIDYFRPSTKQISDLYSAWIVAFSVFRKDYWLHNVSGIRRMADEQTQLCNVHDFLAQNPTSTFAKSRQRSVFQGWTVPGRSTPEYYDKGLRQHIYMDSLNEAWYSGRLDVVQNFPYDFSDSYVTSLLSQELTQAQVQIWEQWKTSDVRYYY